MVSRKGREDLGKFGPVSKATIVARGQRAALSPAALSVQWLSMPGGNHKFVRSPAPKLFRWFDRHLPDSCIHSIAMTPAQNLSSSYDLSVCLKEMEVNGHFRFTGWTAGAEICKLPGLWPISNW